MAHLIQPRYSKLNKRTGKRETRRCHTWYGVYKDSTGRRHRVPLSPDKLAAQALLADLVRKAEWQQAGLASPQQEHGRRPLAEHIAEWRDSLLAKGVSAKQVRLTVGRVERLVAACGFRHIGDIDPLKVQTHLGRLRQQGLSTQTRNFYLSSIKSFCFWLVRHERTASHPLLWLTTENADKDRRHPRRPLSAEELHQLLKATQQSQRVLCGFDGLVRVMLYAVAAGTGLRVSELASLTPASFLLADQVPTVRLQAAYAKNGKQAIQALPPGLVSPLSCFLDGKPARQPVWPGPWTGKAGRMIRKDEEDAGIAYQTDEGFADFHALRHTYITSLFRAGVHARVAQELARHSTLNLTMNVYTHLGPEASRAVAGLVLPLVPACTQAVRKAG